MATGKKYTWHKIAGSVTELPVNANGLCEINVKGKTICFYSKDEKAFACTHKCPHAGGRLADGHVDVLGNIVCPLHRYKFSLENGRNVTGEGYYLKTYPVKADETGIYVGLEEKKGLFGF